jgi:hypothetical protein
MNYNSTGVFVNEGIGPDVDVYLIFGEGNNSYTDKLKSNFDGTFTFPNLEKGHYKVYAYSDCATCASGTEAILVSTDITVDNSTVDVGQIVINQ